MATPGPTLLFTSDSGTRFSPKLDGGVCSLEEMPEEVELTESALYAASDGRQTGTTGATTTTTTTTTTDTPHYSRCHHRHYHHQYQQTLSPLSAASDVDAEDECEGNTAGSLRQRPRSEMARHSHIHAQGLSNHSDGGVLAAETLTDVSPSPGPPPAPPEYNLPQGPAARRQPLPSQIASASGINLRENALASPLIPVAVEFEDGLIPIEVVGAITPTESMTEQALTSSESAVDQPPRGPGSGQASPASTIEPWPPLSPGIPVDRRPSAASIAMPGEEVVFQGGLKIGECKEDGVLYIWQNQLSRDFRIQWHTGSSKETMWMRSSTAQIVPVYAQYHSSPLRAYLRDTNGTQTPAFEFSSLDDLFRLQTSLTGERVVLDVSCARWMRANRPKGDSSAETFTGIRVQIWHETRKASSWMTSSGGTTTTSTTIRRRMSSESRLSTASQTTDGLSGPRRDCMVPQQSRLVVFLGEAGGFLTLPITEDVEMEDKGGVLVKLKARRYGGLRRRRSQPGVRARIVSPTDQPGLPFRNKTVDNTEKYSYYKNLDIEFETEGSKGEFVSVWREVVEFRRKQRAKIEKIQEEMGKETFTGKQAIRQWF